MTFELVPAPWRVLKTYSFVLVIATGIFDSAIVLMQTFADMHLMSAHTLAMVNAGLMFAVGIARMIAQNIPISTADKTAIVAFAAQQPMKTGARNVSTRVGSTTVPATPESKALANRQ